MTRIAILDYGMGNLRSVEKALERVGAAPLVTSDPESAGQVEGLILPGVGAFPKAMRHIRELGLDDLVSARAGAGVPVLGICLGMQLLFEGSSENTSPLRASAQRGSPGLGLLPGRVERLPAEGLKVPHIGWSPVRWEKQSQLLDGLGDEVPFYFVHSFTPVPETDGDVLGTAEYGSRFACAVERDGIFGVQFHPEKSSTAGLKLLHNFAGICARAAAPV